MFRRARKSIDVPTSACGCHEDYHAMGIHDRAWRSGEVRLPAPRQDPEVRHGAVPLQRHRVA